MSLAFAKKLLPFVFLYMTAHISYAQMAIGAGELCYNGDTVISLPVYARSLNQIKGINGVLRFDQSSLTFTGYENLQTFLGNISVVGNQSGQIFIDLKNAGTFSLGDDTVLLLKFKVEIPLVTSLPFIWDTAYYLTSGAVFQPLARIDGAFAVAPLVLTHPQDVSSCVNNSILFEVTAPSTTVYQWEYSTDNGLNWLQLQNNQYFNGVQTELLTVNTVSAIDGYLLRCRVGYAACGVFSDAATLNVIPNILQHPVDTVINHGGTAVFSTLANGINPIYIWQVSTDNGFSWSSSTLFPEVTTPVLTIMSPPSTWHGYKFRCIVEGACSPPADTTQVAALYIGSSGFAQDQEGEVKIFPNPFNDNFFVSFEDMQTAAFSIGIYNINGQMESQFAFESGYDINEISLGSKLAPGIYLLRIVLPDKSLMARVVKL